MCLSLKWKSHARVSNFKPRAVEKSIMNFRSSRTETRISIGGGGENSTFISKLFEIGNVFYDIDAPLAHITTCR